MSDQDFNSHWTYCSLEPLECCAFPGLGRQIGVAASRPFHHAGLNAEYVDVHRETLKLNTSTFGNCYPASSATEKIRAATEATIADLNVAIDELVGHRDRLLATLGEGGAPEPRQRPRRARGKNVVDVELPLFEPIPEVSR